MNIGSFLSALVVAAVFGPVPADAVTCEATEHDGTSYTICRVDVAHEDLRLFLNDDQGQPFGQFTRVDAALKKDGERLVFAMNGGMYHPDRSPVGLYIEEGAQEMRAIPGPGPGNFGLVPNGVLCIDSDRARVIETERYLEEAPDCRFATQSGPMLVIDGELHPRFLEDSTSRYVRNGVGTTSDGREAIFAISDSVVSFHEFGRLFRDKLDVDQALFLDGNVSRLYAPGIGRADFGRQLGPILGVVAPME